MNMPLRQETSYKPKRSRTQENRSGELVFLQYREKLRRKDMIEIINMMTGTFRRFCPGSGV
jgi:hypothetical protein